MGNCSVSFVHLGFVSSPNIYLKFYFKFFTFFKYFKKSIKWSCPCCWKETEVSFIRWQYNQQGWILFVTIKNIADRLKWWTYLCPAFAHKITLFLSCILPIKRVGYQEGGKMLLLIFIFLFKIWAFYIENFVSVSYA